MESQPGFGVSLQLKDCIEELLRFTLASSIEIDLGLSKDYCSTLLQDDPFPNSTGGLSYPLYKHLAASLYQAISSEALPRTENKLAEMQETSSLKQKEKEWASLIKEEGSHLLNVLKSVDFELHVQEPYFSLLRNGQKTVEGRCAVGHYNKYDFIMTCMHFAYCFCRFLIKRVVLNADSQGLRSIIYFLDVRIEPGAFILVNKCLVLQVQDVHHYHSFHEMLEAENLKEVLPGVDTVEKGVEVYRKFYSEEKERSNGVLAISVKKLVSQPSICLGSLLSVSMLSTLLILTLEQLSYAGVQRLLGFVCTVGTVSEALPPPASTLISSFLLPHNPNAKGCTLTDGARALSKHINRSSDRHWGSFSGSDSDKNKVALDVISDLITRCCWMNVHIVPPHGVVFEIRVADGYGARWSKDGSKLNQTVEMRKDKPAVASSSKIKFEDSDEHESSSEDEEAKEIEEELADVTCEELQRARSDGSDTVYRKFNSEAKSGRPNKNRPMEMSSKKPEDNLPAEKEELKKQMRKSNDPEEVNELKNRLSWIDKQSAGTKHTEKEILAEHKNLERETAKQGKQPYYLKKSEIQKRKLVEKYKELRASGKLEAYIEKKRRKNAAKDHRFLPYRRPEVCRELAVVMVRCILFGIAFLEYPIPQES
ncbi:hypothetical protein RND71_010183 [Anisodus tanguticus]|uniref:ASCH domain-containing protein n=1 Tax=Anisodus tanguticus TaxID=243964 RepID=A0AAE1SGQ5_9SOLA|nr:hypothetical protein RND71_010183 [Anisodus tanguticus]